MRVCQPQIANRCDRLVAGYRATRKPVVVYSIAKKSIVLGCFESDHREVEVDIKIAEELKLLTQDIRIPDRLLGELVVGNDEPPLFGFAQMRDRDDKGIPRRCAASTRAVPESSRLFSSIRHGTKKPKVSTLRANIIICFSGCLRGLRSFNISEWIGTYSTVRRGALLRNRIKDFASVIVFLLGDPFAPYLYLYIY